MQPFHGEELARRHLLQRRGMEHVIHPLHGIMKSGFVAHVAYVELDLVRHLGHTGLEVVAHVVLLLLVAAEDPDLAYVGAEEAVEHRIAKTARATRYQQHLVFKNTHVVLCLTYLDSIR